MSFGQVGLDADAFGGGGGLSVCAIQEGSWNYNFQGVKHSTTMHYSLRLDTPLEFYHELHRPSHFLNFSNIEDAHVEADREDVFQ